MGSVLAARFHQRLMQPVAPRARGSRDARLDVLDHYAGARPHIAADDEMDAHQDTIAELRIERRDAAMNGSFKMSPMRSRNSEL